MNILFIIALTFPVAVASTAFGKIDNEQLTINNGQDNSWGKNLMSALILALGQGVMYTLGDLLGSTFMHLMESFSKWIVFALCFSIGFRMLLDTMKIRNGGNLYFIQNTKHLLLLSIALGVNTFIAGLMTEFYEPFQNITPYLLIGTAFIWAVVAMTIPFSKMKLTLNSLLNSIFAGIILVKGLLGLI